MDWITVFPKNQIQLANLQLSAGLKFMMGPFCHTDEVSLMIIFTERLIDINFNGRRKGQTVTATSFCINLHEVTAQILVNNILLLRCTWTWSEFYWADWRVYLFWIMCWNIFPASAVYKCESTDNR